MRIYVASSWRNDYQPDVVATLCTLGHEVYDFRNPPHRAEFGWDEICTNWQDWDIEEFREALSHPLAEAGFASDFRAMQWADALVLVMPCGRSAHLEAGWAVGAGKPTGILLIDRDEPELMYKMATVLHGMEEMEAWLAELRI